MLHEPTTDEIFNNVFCICGHTIEMINKWDGHLDGECTVGESNGGVYYRCTCKKIRPVPFIIEIEIPMENLNA